MIETTTVNQQSLNNTIMYSNDYSRLPKTSSSHQAYDDVVCGWWCACWWLVKDVYHWLAGM